MAGSWSISAGARDGEGSRFCRSCPGGGVRTRREAWSPIGGITFYRDGQHGSTLDGPAIGKIAKAHGKTPAQVMLRWHL
jgi:hypothetical protein